MVVLEKVIDDKSNGGYHDGMKKVPSPRHRLSQLTTSCVGAC